MKISASQLGLTKVVTPTGVEKIIAAPGVSLAEPQPTAASLVQEYVTKLGWRMAENLQDALLARHNAQQVLSPREADVCARGRVNLSSMLLQAALFTEFGAMFMEDIPDARGNIWQARAVYNRGVEWIRTKRATETEEVRNNGDKKLQHLLKVMSDKGLPAWEEEVKDGFKVHMLRPEWLSFEQYAPYCMHQQVIDIGAPVL